MTIHELPLGRCEGKIPTIILDRETRGKSLYISYQGREVRTWWNSSGEIDGLREYAGEDDIREVHTSGKYKSENIYRNRNRPRTDLSDDYGHG